MRAVVGTTVASAGGPPRLSTPPHSSHSLLWRCGESVSMVIFFPFIFSPTEKAGRGYPVPSQRSRDAKRSRSCDDTDKDCTQKHSLSARHWSLRDQVQSRPGPAARKCTCQSSLTRQDGPPDLAPICVPCSLTGILNRRFCCISSPAPLHHFPGLWGKVGREPLDQFQGGSGDHHSADMPIGVLDFWPEGRYQGRFSEATVNRTLAIAWPKRIA